MPTHSVTWLMYKVDMFSCVLSFFWRSYPRSNTPHQSLIANFWPTAPRKINAAYENQHSDNIFFFKGMWSLSIPVQPMSHHFKAYLFDILLLLPAGRKVWAFNGYTSVHGYPKKLTSFGLPRGVRKIDAALYDVESGKTLFFVGNYYFRYVLSTDLYLFLISVCAALCLLPFLNVSNHCVSSVMTRPKGRWTRDSPNVRTRPSLA